MATDDRSVLIHNGLLLDPSGQWVMEGCVAGVDGRIAYAGPAQTLPERLGEAPSSSLRRFDARGGYIVPGFIDVHVHGGGGGDTMEGTPAALAKMAATHARHGTTAFLATTVTAAQPSLIAAAEAVASVCGAPPADWPGARLLGLHLEGPYMNPAKKGAQNPAFMRPPDRGELAELLEVLGPRFSRITLAPELPGAGAIIPWLVERGVGVSIGHTDATYDQAITAFDQGARYATHTFNAMTGLHHRDPGVVGAVFSDDRVVGELIADTVHVHPAAARALIRAKGAAGVILITDAVRAMGLPDGTYELGGLEMHSRGGIMRLPDGTLAGSGLDMGTAVRNLVRHMGLTLAEAVRLASRNPARAAGAAERKGELAVGKDADVVVLDREMAPIATFVEGRLVAEGAGNER